MASKRNAWVSRIATAVVVVAAAVVYFAVPSVNSFVNDLCRRFSTGDFAEMRDFMVSYGAWAAVVSFALMIFQSVAAPLSAFILTFANANLFGWWQGAILSWTSAMAGAAACFWIARSLGREAVEKLCSKTGLAAIERFFERHGDQSVLIARLLPFVSFDFGSYFAGLTSMSFKGFMISTGIGQLPATIVYSYVGRYAHWWCKDAGHGPAHSLCARGSRCFGAAALPRAYTTRQEGGRHGAGAHAVPGDVEPAGEVPPYLVWRLRSLYREGPIL